MEGKRDSRIILVVVATGISSVVTQLLVIRECLVQFCGNEFVIAMILFSWLLISAFGTLAAGFLDQKNFSPEPSRLAFFSLLLAVLSLLQIGAVRILRDVFFIHGSSVGFYQTFLYTFFIISPYTLLLGFVLPYTLFTARRFHPDYPGTKIYIIDNIGDIAGGALFSFVLVYVCTPFQALLAANLPLAAAAFVLFPKRVRYKKQVMLSVLIVVVFIFSAPFFEEKTLSPRQGRLHYYAESRYGRIEIHQDKDQLSLFKDGVHQFSDQNQILAEERIHYPLSQVSELRHILVVSAEGGIMEEIEKYHPESIDYVEIDPLVTQAALKFNLIKNIKNLNVIHQDARAYIKTITKKYDAVIINLPEPETFQLNRFYTSEFFDLVKKHLSASGILSFSVNGFDNYLSPAQKLKIDVLYATAAVHFKHILLLPGQRVFFLCSNTVLDKDIPASLVRKNINTDYVAHYFYGSLTQERIERLNTGITLDVPLNLDYSPKMICIMFSQWFAKFSSSPMFFLLVAALILYVYLMIITKESFILFTTGFMTMGSEILVIFAFQIFFGYIYTAIGGIVTLFLAGLLPGAVFGEKYTSKSRSVMAASDLGLIFLLAAFIFGVVWFGSKLPAGAYLVFGFMVSLLCGIQFPAALFLKGKTGSAAVQAFSADLMGAAFGILVTSVVLLPFFGLVWTAAGLICIKLLSLSVSTLMLRR